MGGGRISDQAIAFGRPMLDEREIAAVVRVLSGTTLVHGPATHEFEKRFAERVGAAYAVAVSSCTAGLHLSLLAQGVAAGDEVVVPAMTHVATAHAAEYCGARPVFVDVQEDTGNLDPDALADALGSATRAVMVVHFLGLPCEMDRITQIADRAGAAVIEDYAIALDATWNGRKTGVLGASGCFSFYPIKHMTTIEGGMVTTNDLRVARSIAQRRAFGYDRTVAERTKPGVYGVTALGYNYRMNEVEAAVGLVQLDKLDEHQTRRAANFAALKEALSDIDELTVFSPVRGVARSSHYCLNAVLPRNGRIDRDAIVASLKEAGIGTSVHYPAAVPLITFYKEKYGFRSGQFPIAEWLAEQTISLPVGPHLTDDCPRRIADAMRAAIVRARG